MIFDTKDSGLFLTIIVTELPTRPKVITAFDSLLTLVTRAR